MIWPKQPPNRNLRHGDPVRTHTTAVGDTESRNFLISMAHKKADPGKVGFEWGW
jgi:hypothetical protein